MYVYFFHLYKYYIFFLINFLNLKITVGIVYELYHPYHNGYVSGIQNKKYNPW